MSQQPTRIAICGSCHSHFVAPLNPDPEEDPAAGLHCPACLEWAHLLEQQSLYAGAVAGRRGGRR